MWSSLKECERNLLTSARIKLLSELYQTSGLPVGLEESRFMALEMFILLDDCCKRMMRT